MFKNKEMEDKIYDLGLYDYDYTTNPISSSDQEGESYHHQKIRRRKKYLLDFLDVDGAKKGDPKRLSHPPSDEEDEEKTELKGQEEKVKNVFLISEGAQDTKKDITGEMFIDHEKAHSSKIVIEKEKGSKDHDDEASLFELSQDIFSIMFVSPVFSSGFLYGIFVYTLQISILMLALYGLLNQGNPANQLNIPLYVNLNVVIAQISAIFVIIFSADDVVKSFDIFHIQYDDSVKDIFPSATLFKLYLTYILRVIEGYLVVFVTYLFVLQSYDVMELFLDFAAVQFVGELDEIGFYLAKKGERR